MICRFCFQFFFFSECPLAYWAQMRNTLIFEAFVTAIEPSLSMYTAISMRYADSSILAGALFGLGCWGKEVSEKFVPRGTLQCCQWFLVGIGRLQAQCDSAKGFNGDGDRCVHVFGEALIILGNCFKIHSVIVLVVMVLAATSLVSNSFNLKVHCHCLPPILATYL